MKKLLFILLLSPLSYSDAEDINLSFDLNCKVTGQVLIASKDGVSYTYSGYKDGLENGDMFKVNITFKTFFDSYSLIMDNDDLLISEYMRSSESEATYGGGSLEYKRGYLGEDFITLKGVFSETSLKRYFKNDWHLMNTNWALVGDTRRTLTANCMNMPDEWDKVISRIKEMEKVKWEGINPKPDPFKD